MKIVIYTNADDNYARQAVVPLKSVQRFHDYDLFVISGGLKDENIEFLKSHGIGHVQTDVHKNFPNTKPWTNTCFLMILAPEIFCDMGYDYSLGAEADVYCDKPLDMEKVFRETEGYAGIALRGPRRENFHNAEYIKEKHGLSDADMSSHNTNGGVMFWNNKAIKEFELSKKCLDAWENNAFKASAQSLFALVSIGLPFNILPSGYNYRPRNYHDRNVKEEDIRMYHYTGTKPWRGKTEHGEKWSEFYKKYNEPT